jgi:hypothetical protein
MAKRTGSTANDFAKNRYFNTQEFEATAKRMTSYLRSLASRRSSATVTADDVHNYLNRAGVQPKQVRTRLKFINSVFGSGMFEQTGTVASSRPAAKGRAISAWTIA